MKLYAGKVSLCDHWVGAFLEKVKDMGMYDNTLIIYTTDHGELFGEHGIVRKAKPFLYQELVHIPLLLGIRKVLGQANALMPLLKRLRSSLLLWIFWMSVSL